MNFDSYIEETMDEAMLPYTTAKAYITERNVINQMIGDFKSSLTSVEQQNAFMRLLDAINNADADFSVQAYTLGFKAGMKFKIDR